MPAKMVFVVRKDLKMPSGKIGAQIAHATQYMCEDFLTKSQVNGWFTSTIWSAWRENDIKKIVLGCEDENELRSIMAKAKEDDDLPCYPVIDIGLTHFQGVKTLTCAGIGPTDEFYIDKVTGHLKPLR